MKVKIIEKKEIILYGFSFFGDPFKTHDVWQEDNEIGQLWYRFMDFFEKNKEKIKNIKDEKLLYEIHIDNEETKIKGLYEVFVGIEIEKAEDLPVDGLIKILPACEYGVFTLKGEQIQSDWAKEIFEKWMPESGYSRAHNFGFNLYDDRFKGMDNIKESELDVYVPIKK